MGLRPKGTQQPPPGSGPLLDAVGDGLRFLLGCDVLDAVSAAGQDHGAAAVQEAVEIHDMILRNALGLDPEQDIGVAGKVGATVEIDLDDGSMLAQVSRQLVESRRGRQREDRLQRRIELLQPSADPVLETGQVSSLNILNVDVGMALIADGQRRPDCGLTVLILSDSPDADRRYLLAGSIGDPISAADLWVDDAEVNARRVLVSQCVQ